MLPRFIEKYNTTIQNKNKKELRELFMAAQGDFELAETLFVAKIEAFKTDMKKGEWLSEEQLQDLFKNAEHTKNYIEAANQCGFTRKDPMRKCTEYYYEKIVCRPKPLQPNVTFSHL